MNRSLVLLPFRSLSILGVLAAPVLAQTLTEFQNGQVANATQVNANFTALKDAVQAAQTSFGTLNATVTTQGTSLTNLTDAIAVTAPKVQLDRRLQFPSTTVSRKVVLYETADNDHQFLGFGINAATLRY